MVSSPPPPAFAEASPPLASPLPSELPLPLGLPGTSPPSAPTPLPLSASSAAAASSGEGEGVSAPPASPPAEEGEAACAPPASPPAEEGEAACAPSASSPSEEGEASCAPSPRAASLAPPPLSKRAAKRAARHASYEERRPQRKAAKREAKKAAAAASREERRRAWEALSAEEQAARRLQAREAREGRGESAARRGAACGGVVIDCDFDALMSEREVSSLVQQLMYAYGANRRADAPVDLHLTSVSGRVAAGLAKINGFDSWRHKTPPLTPHEASYLQVFAPAELVYLSSEAEETLTALEPSAVYVIGGLVDHNRHRGLTHARATAAGVRTARLPIDEHLVMSQRRVLAVNHVFEILLLCANGTSWRDALMTAVPQRRGATVQPEETADGVSTSLA
ncbi:hypothetical protein AB1Y20_020903 [Prymnesium parvum]|uniref:tRNA (guanine(9)-N(1))-methyltransferase n=1 Tax=Prymnesium parvum TaxID=97485 RepID=A0AB34JIK3_PRYPA